MAKGSCHRLLSEPLAEHIVGLQYDHVPAATVERAKLWILDSIGATLAGAITTQDLNGLVIRELVLNTRVEEHGWSTIRRNPRDS